MRQRSTFLVLLLAMAAATAMAAEGAPAGDPAVLQRLLEAQRGVTTLSGRFTQSTVRADDPAGGGTELQGHVDLQAPDHYNLVYTNPKDAEWRLRHCSDGVTRWQVEQLFAGEAPEVTAKPVAGGGAAGAGGGEDADVVGRIAALLRGDRLAVMKDFTAQATAAGEGFALVLTPRPGPLADHLVRVEADLDAAAHVQVLRFFDRQGNRVSITVADAVYNQPIPAETFTYTAP
jgi:outer membrane lipoprotein-sorting protein